LLTLFIPALLGLILATGVFYHVQPLFAVILGAWSCTHLGFCFFFARKCAHLSHVHSESRSTLNGRIVDSLTNYLNAKLFANRRYELNYITNYQNDEKAQNQKQLRYIEILRLVLAILAILGPGIGILGYAFYSWLHYRLSVGEVVLIFNGTWNMMYMVWVTGVEIPNFFREWGICRQALSLIQTDHEIVNKNNKKILKVGKGSIRFDNVYFHYKNSPAIFEDKTLEIPAGQKVGLVGYSGSGKSTFVNLILRLYDIQSGKILIDNQDISEVTQESLRTAIAMIPQEPSLFHRSLMENIRYGCLTASDEEVFAFAKKAHAHDFIQQLPDGYETLVGERGIKLSGGQRQRIAIARAMIKNAPILILDEATSALDSVTEAVIQESLSQLMDDRTAIVIAHRLSTLLHMDRILVFDQGQLIQDGTHEQLLAEAGHYRILWDAQVGGFIPDNPLN
jgi:ATP-binding cassette, subfamily B, bacterial